MNLKLIYKQYTTRSNGKSGLDYRLFLYKDKDFIKKASFWHDIPWKNEDGTFNMVVEVPSGDIRKMEMSKHETHNPIRQDIKINKLTGQTYLRYYKHTPFFNYGFIPQTWENNKKLVFGKYYGDDDPVDIIDISGKRFKTGQTIKVKILGGFCLIDEGEADWKVVAHHCDTNDGDSPRHISQAQSIIDWFRVYKTYDGKAVNTTHGNLHNAEEIMKVINETHEDYIKLISSKI
jgi:inorganic pyrophosphatase